MIKQTIGFGARLDMPKSRGELFDFLTTNGINFETHEHPPVFTVEESHAHTAHIAGGHTKNLFLEDKKGGLWLVTCRAEQPVKVNALARLMGAPRVSFGKAERLMDILGVKPGSVTPLALINDVERRVQPVVDKGLLDHSTVNVHPLENNATTNLKSEDLLRFMELLNYQPIILDVAQSIEAK